VIPKVNVLVLKGEMFTVFSKVFAFDAAAAAILTFTVAVATDDVKLAIASVETIAEVAEGTVYKVVSDVLAGADCPRTLYTVGIYYIPPNIRISGKAVAFDPDAPVAPVAPAGPVAPVAPAVPVAPSGPVAPTGPVAPSGPVGPMSPVTP